MGKNITTLVCSAEKQQEKSTVSYEARFFHKILTKLREVN